MCAWGLFNKTPPNGSMSMVTRHCLSLYNKDSRIMMAVRIFEAT